MHPISTYLVDVRLCVFFGCVCVCLCLCLCVCVVVRSGVGWCGVVGWWGVVWGVGCGVVGVGCVSQCGVWSVGCGVWRGVVVVAGGGGVVGVVVVVVLRCVALGWVGFGWVVLCCVRAHVHVWVCCVWEWGRGWGFLCALTLCACVRVCVICICMCVHVPFLEEPRKPSWPEQIFLFLQPLVCHIWQIRRKTQLLQCLHFMVHHLVSQ